MAIITSAEVKSILQIEDTYIVSESVTMDSVVYKRLTYKPVTDIISVSGDTRNSTVSSTQYTTLDYYTTQDAGNYENIRRIDTGTIADTQTVYVSYTYNDYDSIISVMIPFVQDDLCNYLNNYFPDLNTTYTSGTISMVAGTPATITDSDSQFVIEGFEGGMDIHVTGTYRNNGIYSIASAGVAAGTITLATGEVLLSETDTDEYGGNNITITRIKWPNEIKHWVAQIIWHNMERIKSSNIQSKSIGPSSVTYMPLGMGGYPKNIIDGLAHYKQARII